MHKNDLTLFQFANDFNYFHDHQNEKNSQFLIECSNIIDNKLYSDIDIQDEKGNTVLHYFFKNQNWEWCNKFLKLGANPYIKNNANYSCFAMARMIDGIVNFWKLFDDLDLDSTFKEATEHYHPLFKEQLFFQTLERRNGSFSSISDLLSFLKENDLYNPKNLTNALGLSRFISLTLRIKEYLKHEELHTAENNNNFLSLFTRFLVILKSKDIPAIEELFKLNFEDNSVFKEVLSHTLMTYEGKIDQPIDFLTEMMIKKVIHSEFDLNQPWGFSQIKLHDLLISHPFANSCYLSYKLGNDLNDTKVVKLRNKI